MRRKRIDMPIQPRQIDRLPIAFDPLDSAAGAFRVDQMNREWRQGSRPRREEAIGKDIKRWHKAEAAEEKRENHNGPRQETPFAVERTGRRKLDGRELPLGLDSKKMHELRILRAGRIALNLHQSHQSLRQLGITLFCKLRPRQ